MTAVNLNELRGQVELLRFIKQREAELAELKKAARAAIEAVMESADTGTLDGEVAISWKTSKRTALSQAILRERFPDVYEECKETTEVRRFEVQ